MRLWELEGGETVQWRTRVLELSIFPGLEYTCPNACVSHLLPLPTLPSAHLCQCVSCPPELLIRARIPPPFPSLPFPPPFPSLPFLPLRKTEQVTLFPWLHTHTQHFPLQDFWPLLIASAQRKEGRKGAMLYPASLPMFLGIVLGCSLPASCVHLPIILQGL